VAFFTPRLVVGSLLLALAALAATKRPAAPLPKPNPAVLKASPTVRRWMKTMTLHDEVAQLVFIAFHGEAPNVRSKEYRRFVRLIHDTKIGGLVLNNVSNGRTIQKAEPYAVAAFVNRLQRMTAVPLMVAGDFERGASMRVDGTTVFPHAMALGATGDPTFSRYEGEITAREARALGVQWLFYPVADVNNNPDNPIINIRSFGENPKDVAAHVKAFIEGAHSDKRNFVLTTAKHFPGHGDTAVDTHANLASIPADRDRLDRLELVPFRAAIEGGVDAIMTAHIAVPALAPPDLPATLSPAILTDLLRKQLGFNGLVVTDALEMGGIAKGYSAGEASVKALEAGADTLLMPADPDAAIAAVMSAVNSGRLTRQRIQTSVLKILAAKEKVGLDRKRFADVESLGDVIDSPESNEMAQEIANRAVTLVRNTGSLIPLAAPERSCFIVLSESRYSAEGQAFTNEVRKRVDAPSAKPPARAAILTLDPSIPRQQIEDSLSKFAGCETYTVAAFAAVTANRGIGLGGDLGHAIEIITATGKPIVMVALGNPYLLRSFPQVNAYLATFSTVPPSEIAAVRALFGEINIRGHLPVAIPGLAGYHDGIQLTGTKAIRITGSQQ